MSPRRQKQILILAGLFAFGWSVARACTQSVAQDEGDTYAWFASRSASHIWYPFPNNHVLNTLLIWITTRVLGPSTFSLRLPALLGALFYICVCYFLCRNLTSRFSLQLPVFLCLVYNPFILDFMAAARGYSLANAFLVAAIAIPLWHHAKGRPSVAGSCAWASLAIGLSFAANYFFVFADFAVLLGIAVWALKRGSHESLLPITVSCIMPGLIVALILCAYPLTHWPKSEPFYTAHSIGETERSVVNDTLYELAPPFKESILNDVKPLLLPVIVILGLIRLMMTARDGSTKMFAWALGGIIALTVLLHWITFRVANAPLPLSRTAIFFMPLCTLFFASIAAVDARSRVSRWLRLGMTGTFVALACYFMFCLRFTYFKEYKDEEELKYVYAVLAQLNHQYGVTDIHADELYVNSLNFARVASNKETIPEIAYSAPGGLPAGKQVYVVNEGYYREFIEKEKLAIVYRGKKTAVAVAVRTGGAIPTTMITP